MFWALREAVKAGVYVVSFRILNERGIDTGTFDLVRLRAAIRASPSWQRRAARASDVSWLIEQAPGALWLDRDGRPISLTEAQVHRVTAGVELRQRNAAIDFHKQENSAKAVECGSCGMTGVNVTGVKLHHFVKPTEVAAGVDDDSDGPAARFARARGWLCAQTA